MADILEKSYGMAEVVICSRKEECTLVVAFSQEACELAEVWKEVVIWVVGIPGKSCGMAEVVICSRKEGCTLVAA